MKNFIISLIALMATISFTSILKADDHAEQSYFNFQVNFCKLNEGSTMEDYSNAVNNYIKWSKKNDVEVYVSRQKALFPHDNFVSDRGYDFQEILAGPHNTTGKAWDMWLGTKEGQKLAKKWQEAATCYVKWGHAYPLFTDQKALESDEDRVVSWNWCTRKDGVSLDDLQARHGVMVEELKKDNIGLSGWFIVQPVTGAAQAPGGFVHLGFYDDVESFMKYKEAFAAGGWADYVDYTDNYASCSGEELYSEEVLNFPKD